MKEVHNGKEPKFSLNHASVLKYSSRLCVPDVGNLRMTLLEEARNSGYTVHLGSTKMYQDLKQLFCWEGMKRDIGDFVSHCLVYQ